MTPPTGRVLIISRISSRESACSGVWRISALAATKVSKSWWSRFLRSVTTTIVGFFSALLVASIPARQAISKLLPAPWVCHMSPPRPSPLSALAVNARVYAFCTAKN